MNAEILCQLISNRIDPKCFGLNGLNVCWNEKAYDTPKNQAIVADVIANYAELEVAYLEKQQEIVAARESNVTAVQAICDAYPSWEAVERAINNISTVKDAKKSILAIARIVYYLSDILKVKPSGL